MAIYVLMLGAPGAGKGTQAQLLSQRLAVPHISSGDIFRENKDKQTELGRLAAQYMNKGELVPDDVTIAMIKERLTRSDCQKGAVLDGFPRTTAQAQALDTMLVELDGKVDVVPYIKVDAEVLIDRLTGRWTCRGQGHIYHERYSPPKVPGICDIDGSELYQRDDDKEETVRNRIQVYLQQTAPLIEYYQAAGVLKMVEGNQQIERVTEDLMAVMPPYN